MVGGRQPNISPATAERENQEMRRVVESPKEGSSELEECAKQTERNECVQEKPSECVEQVENGMVHSVELEENTAETMRAKRRTKSAGFRQIAVSYAKMLLFGMGYGLIALVYWILTSLTTSYNSELGFISLSCMFSASFVLLVLGPSIVTLFGVKTCLLSTALGAVVLSVSYFYPSWYTVLPASVLLGVVYALIFTSAGLFVEGEAHSCVDKAGVDLVIYRGRFSAIYLCFDGAGSIVAGITTAAILFLQGDASGVGDGSTVTNTTTVQLPNMTTWTPNISSDVHSSACRDLPLSAVSLPAGSTKYYIVVAACTIAAVLAVLVMAVLRTHKQYGCKICAFGLKGGLRHIAVHTVKVLKQMSTPPFTLLAPTPVHIGLSAAFFFGTFTKMFITDCIGIEYIGLATIVWGLCNGVGAIGGGWLSACVPSSVLFLAVAVGKGACLLFLVIWERTPSLTVVLIAAVLFGLAYGIELCISTICAGTVPAKNREIGYSIVFIWYCGGHLVEFFISPYISLEGNIFLILAVLVVAVIQFSTADFYFGSAKGAKCLGWYKPQASKVEEDGARQENGLGGEPQVQEDAVSITSNQSAVHVAGDNEDEPC